MEKLIASYGIAWPRNKENLKQLREHLGKKTGVYVLTHGAMPMYVGKGQIARRIRGHARPGSSKSRYWDYFSWFALTKEPYADELEVILLRCLPFYVRSLNRQTGSLGKKNRVKPASKNGPIPVKFPSLIRRKRRKKHRK